MPSPADFFSRYRSVVRPFIVVTSLGAALLVTLYRREDTRGLALATSDPVAASGRPRGERANLASLQVLQATLTKIRDNYVDPTRISPKKMLLAALDHVQKNVAEVLVEPSADERTVTVRVDRTSHTFDIATVDSPWALASKLKEVFRFVQTNLHPQTEVKDVEYVAVNGMLSTLDPHSVLLDPEMARQMKIETSGQFGGLGIEIGMRKDMLTVIRLIHNQTPAAKAGLKPGDRIVRINDESTVNMLLSEAVKRLRGDPSTPVTIYVERDGDKQPRKVVVMRDQIRLPALDPAPRMLKGGVGYIRVSHFSQKTEGDVRTALSTLQKQGLRGLVLDLRGNPGGLLDQAIKLSDLFIERGTIVTTVGFAGKQRDEKHAQAGGEPRIPLVVLVNSGSASASEIVAGALKNLDRAVVIGQTTFGKGSVQVLYDNDDSSQLKLTIAQYLTPGDISIQSVGIVPDIATQAVKIDKEAVIFEARAPRHREADLESHLTNPNKAGGAVPKQATVEKPTDTVRYLYQPPAGEKPAKVDEDDDEVLPPGDDDDDEPPPAPVQPEDRFVEDFEVRLGRDLVAAMPNALSRREMLAQAKSFLDKHRGEEEQKIAAALGKLGIDWSQEGAGPGARLKARLEALPDKGAPEAGKTRAAASEKVTFHATVTNDGTAAAVRVRGKLRCGDDCLFDERELVFGRIKPGESRTYDVVARVPRSALSRLDVVIMEVSDSRGKVTLEGPAALARVESVGLLRPAFAYSWELVDDVRGNGDGLLQKGEHARLVVVVKNVGEGRSYKTQTTLKNTSGQNVFVYKGRYHLDNLKPGESRKVEFDLEVKPEFEEEVVNLELAVFDTTLGKWVNEALKLPIVAAGPAPAPAHGGAVEIGGDAVLRSGASNDAPVVGNARKGAAFKVTGKLGGFYRIEAEPGRPAFVATSAVARTLKSADVSKRGVYAPVWQVSPPDLRIDGALLETSGTTLPLRGTVTDDSLVTDVFVLVSNRATKQDRKVFYQSNRSSGTPNKMSFEASVPLSPGSNWVRVIARKNQQVRSDKVLIVHRTETGELASGARPAPRQ